MAKAKRSEFMITSLDRGLRILDILANESDGLGVSELGRRLASDKSVVFRTLSSKIRRQRGTPLLGKSFRSLVDGFGK